MKLTLLFLLLLPVSAFAQAMGIDSVRRESATIHRPLPPSMLLELRRSQKGRTLIYRDTVHASDLEHAHASDTTERAYTDSAFAVIDTAVSLSDKQWLDSELVEAPELARFGNRIHFNYPAAIMTESEMTQVPFDSTILDRMNPVTREILPFFDQSPIPMPLPIPRPTEAFLELGGGNIDQPSAKAFLIKTFSERTYASVLGDFVSRPTLPLKWLLDLGTTFHASLGADPALLPMHSTELDASLGLSDRWLSLHPDSLRSTLLDHNSAVEQANISLHGDAGNMLQYRVAVEDCEWGKDADFSESSQFMTLNLTSAITDGYQLSAHEDYSHSALSSDGPGESNRTALLFGNHPNNRVFWDAGVAVLSGISVGQSFAPIAHLRLALNPRWEAGASFDPRSQLSTMVTLLASDPFYNMFSGRGAVIDKLSFHAFMTYALSADDALRLEARFITRDHEPVFRSITRPDSITVVTASPASTRRTEFTAAGNFLLFERDILTTSMTLIAATNLDSDMTMPFEPKMKFEAAYRFNSLSETLRPSIHLRSFVLSDRTLGMIDLELRAQLSEAIAATLRIENILNGASDFWPGYSEAPRSVSVSARYAF